MNLSNDKILYLEQLLEIKDGKKYISCLNAFQFAEKFHLEKKELARFFTTMEIKIANCQLGCF